MILIDYQSIISFIYLKLTFSNKKKITCLWSGFCFFYDQILSFYIRFTIGAVVGNIPFYFSGCCNSNFIKNFFEKTKFNVNDLDTWMIIGIQFGDAWKKVRKRENQILIKLFFFWTRKVPANKQNIWLFLKNFQFPDFTDPIYYGILNRY